MANADRPIERDLMIRWAPRPSGNVRVTKMEPDDRLVIAASVLPRLVVMFIIWYLIIIVTKIEPDDLLAILVLSCLPSSG